MTGKRDILFGCTGAGLKTQYKFKNKTYDSLRDIARIHGCDRTTVADWFRDEYGRKRTTARAPSGDMIRRVTLVEESETALWG